VETSPRWQRIKELFQSALEREPEHRSAFLAEVCADDLSLKAELESLLSSFELADSFLPTRPMGSAADSGNLVNPEVWEGQSVGAYKLIRPLAHGGMGIVLLAVRADEQFQKRVAIKLIKRGMDSAAILRRFRNERQILAGLDHPYIARLLDGGTTEAGLPYFVMEYIEGQPIDEY
jgi:hypothetical protein